MFLIVIGLKNLSALLGLVRAAQHLRARTFDEDALEHHLHDRGFLARIRTHRAEGHPAVAPLPRRSAVGTGL